MTAIEDLRRTQAISQTYQPWEIRADIDGTFQLETINGTHIGRVANVFAARRIELDHNLFLRGVAQRIGYKASYRTAFAAAVTLFVVLGTVAAKDYTDHDYTNVAIAGIGLIFAAAAIIMAMVKYRDGE